MTLLAAALISLVAWLKPQLLRWFYSPDFRPAIHYLRWTLLGDYLKVTSWVLSIPILAAAEIKVFLAADLVSCGVFVGAFTVLASRRNAATSAGMAFVLMYAAHMSICAAHLARHHAFVPTRPAAWAWTAGLVMVVASSALSWHQL